MTLALNVNYVDVPERRVLFVEPSQARATASTTSSACRKPSSTTTSATSRTRYDFDSVRVGIQPFQADFRGFLFNDQQLGIRLFGNRDNNRFQYNLAAFWRLEKDTNSGLNAVLQTPRDDWLFDRQRLPPGFPDPGADQPGHASPATCNREARRHRDRRQRLPGAPGAARHAARARLRRGLPRLQRRRAHRPDQPDRQRLCRARRGPEQLLHRPQGRHPRLLRRRRAQLRHGLDALPPLGRSRRAATAIRSTTPKAASTRCSRTRSSPAPTPATGSARPSRSPAAGGRSRSTAATASSTRCARRRSRASRTSTTRALMLLGAGADFDLTPELRAVGQRQPPVVREHRHAAGAARRRLDPARRSAGTCRRRRSGGRRRRRTSSFRLSAATLLAGRGLPRPVRQQPTATSAYYSVLANAILSY